jgi:hypothetical protein
MKQRPVDNLAEAVHLALATHPFRQPATWQELDDSYRRAWCQAVDALMTVWLAMPKAEAAYYDPRCPVRLCDCCEQTYRGPAVYCCHACALDDAGG